MSRCYEDLSVGDVYRAPHGRTVTQADNIWFSLLTNNSNPIHSDAHYAQQTEFKRPLVNSLFTLAVVVGLAVPDTSENGIALGWEKIDMTAPVFEGDTIYAESEVLSKRESRSRPGQGIVTFRQRGIKQDGTVVIELVRTVMVWKREHAPVRNTFPTPR